MLGALGRYLGPERFRRYHHLSSKETRILDVGCGNNSPALSKKYFPKCDYTGVDYKEPDDLSEIDRFLKVDLNGSLEELEGLEDGSYDLIFLSHVIEHINSVERLLPVLAHKVSSTGKIYVEFPSVRSLSLPSMHGTLNFCDDETHIRVHTVENIANILLQCGLRIEYGGRRFNWVLAALTPVVYLYKILISKPIEGYASAFWDVCHFADVVIATPRE